ncbi:peptidoglycan-binding protein [Streptomyces sp. NPDC126497]|uniref:peptidoglycan-binding domain-containing protein n=1 Tax=Streptomyces sp. NPDC126497 TaxID=3155313 RepID=UPI003330C3D8
MADVKVWFTGLECRIRQEELDEVVGTVQLFAGINPQPLVKIPESGFLELGKDAPRIAVVQRLLYSGPVQDLSVSATLVEIETSDPAEAEKQKQALAQAVSAAVTAALSALAGGAVGAVAAPVVDVLASLLVDFIADELLGMGPDAYQPSAIALPAARLLSADGRRRTLQRPDDPRTLQYTDELVLTGVDDAGDLGVYAIYLDIQPSAPAPTPAPMEPGGGATDVPTLSLGSQGPAVRILQHLLNHHLRRGERLAVDGDFGPVTEARVREFQQRAGITVDGVVGPQTWETLTSSGSTPHTSVGAPTLSLGSQGHAVRVLQRLLNHHVRRGERLAVDGDFGPVTEARVREFQQRAGITVDGVVGPRTWETLTR